MNMGRTWDFLFELGFETQAQREGFTPKATYDFGTFVLTASDTMGKYFRQVVAFGGSYANSRSVAVIEFELPEHLASTAQCAAMIYYYLRNYDVVFEPDWWQSAAANEHLLPWRKKKDRQPEDVVTIRIKVACSQSDRGDGAWWNVNDVIDERDSSSLGDCGVYEFDAEKGFPARIEEYTLKTLGGLGEFETGRTYVVEIKLLDGTTELGQSVQRFSKNSTMTPLFNKQ
jgi:hypothetical protein